MKSKEIIGYKGFDSDLKCRGFQYKIGMEYKEEKAEVCKCGFHFCENPLDILMTYPPASDREMNRFCVVKGYGKFDTSEPHKIACTNIKIESEIDLGDIAIYSSKYIKERIKKDEKGLHGIENYGRVISHKKREITSNTGDCSAAISEEYASVASNTGDYSLACVGIGCAVAGNTGNMSVSYGTGGKCITANTGDYSASLSIGTRTISANTGRWSFSFSRHEHSIDATTGTNSVAQCDGMSSISATTGNKSVAKTELDKSIASSTGSYSSSISRNDFSISANTGDDSKIVSKGKVSISVSTGLNSDVAADGECSIAIGSGRWSNVRVSGEDSIAIEASGDGAACGRLGCWLVFVERDYSREPYRIIGIKTFKVDGENIKENTYYRLKNGELIEC